LRGRLKRHNIEIAIKKLELNYPEAEVNFWGKIEGKNPVFIY
jgi:hypothetical protein